MFNIFKKKSKKYRLESYYDRESAAILFGFNSEENYEYLVETKQFTTHRLQELCFNPLIHIRKRLSIKDFHTHLKYRALDKLRDDELEEKYNLEEK